MLGCYKNSSLPNPSPVSNPLQAGSIAIIPEAIQGDHKLVVDGHLRVVGSVDEQWIRADFGEDFVKCNRVDAEVLLKCRVKLFMVFVGCKDEGQIGRRSPMAKLSVEVIAA